jgi:hypothetical protein
VSGGSFKPIMIVPSVTEVFADGHDIYLSPGSEYKCANRYDETANTTVGFHYPSWPVVATDATHFYYTPFLGLVRLPR